MMVRFGWRFFFFGHRIRESALASSLAEMGSTASGLEPR